MQHPKQKGDRTTLAVMTALHSAGFGVLVPFGENNRYDLAIDDGSRLARVQCKTGRLRNGAVWFATCSSYAHHRSRGAPTRTYVGEVEFFAVHSAETGGVYLVPIQHVHTRRTCALRVTPARNAQRKRIRLARDYKIGTVAICAANTVAICAAND